MNNPSSAGLILGQIVKDLIFLRQLCGHGGSDISPESPAGAITTTYLSANSESIKGLIAWYYEKTTEEQRRELSNQNPRVDGSTLSEGFQKIALSIVEHVTTFRSLGYPIEQDGLAMLLRALQAINEYSQSMAQPPPLYRFVMSPVEAIWPAWQAAYP